MKRRVLFKLGLFVVVLGCVGISVIVIWLCNRSPAEPPRVSLTPLITDVVGVRYRVLQAPAYTEDPREVQQVIAAIKAANQSVRWEPDRTAQLRALDLVHSDGSFETLNVVAQPGTEERAFYWDRMVLTGEDLDAVVRMLSPRIPTEP